MITALLTAAAIAAAPPSAEPPPRTVTVVARAPVAPALADALRLSYLEERPGNAAIGYLQATIALPAGADAERLDEWTMLTVDELARADVRRAHDIALDSPVLGGPDLWQLTERAARCATCDWQTPVREEHIGALMPEVSRVRRLARILAVRARIQMAGGDLDGARRTIAVGLELSRDLQQGPTLIQALVGGACTSLFLDQVTELIQRDGAPNLYWPLTELPRPIARLQPALDAERRLVELILPELETLGDVSPRAWPAVADRLVEIVALASGSSTDPDGRSTAALMTMRLYPRARRHFLDRGWSAADLDAMPVSQVAMLYAAEGYRHWRDEVVKWTGLSFADGYTGLRAAESAMTAARDGGDGPSAWPFDQLMASIGRAWLAQAVVDRQLAALRCVEAIRAHAALHGAAPASLDAITVVPVPDDPMLGRPFDYAVSDGVVTLRAAAPDEAPSRTITDRLHLRLRLLVPSNSGD